MMTDASICTSGSDYATHPGSPPGRPSRPSKKVHNFGKRSNSIKRNPNAPVVRSGWLFKQDSAGMKLWKKRWFVLSDMCLFYYRDEKEEGILGSILLPSFHISMLSVDDHINKKYSFKATHPNMRTYYFCTDTAKDMESWMRVMTDAALVHTEPIKRQKMERCIAQEMNSTLCRRVVTRHEAHQQVLVQSEIQSKDIPWEAGVQCVQERERRSTDSGRAGESYDMRNDGAERPRPKSSSSRLQPGQAAAIVAAVISCAHQSNSAAPQQVSQYKVAQVNGAGDVSQVEDVNAPPTRASTHALPQRDSTQSQALPQKDLTQSQPQTQKDSAHSQAPSQVDSIYFQTIPQRDSAPPQKDPVQRESTHPQPQRDSTNSQAPPQKDSTHLQAPPQRDSTHSQAPPQRDYTQSQAPPQRDSTHSQAPPQKDYTQSQAPPQRDSIQSQAPSQQDSTHSQAPPQRDCTHLQLPPLRDSTHSQTLPQSDSTHSQVPPQRDSSHLQVPPYRDSTHSQAPPLADTTHLQVPPYRDSSHSQAPPLVDSIHLQVPPYRDSTHSQASPLVDSTHSQVPLQRESSHSKTQRDPAHLQTPHLRDPANTQLHRDSSHFQASSQRDPTQFQTLPKRDCSRSQAPPQEPEKTLQRTNSMQQLEQWVRIQRGRVQEDDTRSISSYLTLPRKMPSQRAQVVSRYPEGYRTLPRNSMMRPDSICSLTPSLYDRALGGPSLSSAEKRRSMRDDTMWQLYEWRQRQTCVKHVPQARGSYSTLPNPRTLIHPSDHMAPSIPTSPSHGSLARCQAYPSFSSYGADGMSSHLYQGDTTIDRRHRTHVTQYVYPPDRRLLTASIPVQTVTAQSLQSKTPEELTLLLIKLRRQQAELSTARQHTLAQLLQLNLDGANPKALPEDYRDSSFAYRQDELDIDVKLSRLCEQDKVVRTQEHKLQQLYREKHTLETALLSASQEIEMSAGDQLALQSVVQQRDLLQSGLLSTCRELSRTNASLERSWREYDRLEADVTLIRNNLLEQLEALGTPQTEPPSQQHVQIQKELWRIQDVTEALSKNRTQRSTEPLGTVSSKAASNQQKSEGPDYRLYKSEPELTTVAEVEESNGDDKTEMAAEKEPASTKGLSYPVGVVSPRTKSPIPESSTIASYVTMRKGRKPDPKTERPHSAVEQAHPAEMGRPRMSVEEQLERIRRHRQGSLRGRKKGSSFSVVGRTPDNFHTMQTRKRSGVSPEIQELLASLREQDLLKEKQLAKEKEQESASEQKEELMKEGEKGASEQVNQKGEDMLKEQDPVKEEEKELSKEHKEEQANQLGEELMLKQDPVKGEEPEHVEEQRQNPQQVEVQKPEHGPGDELKQELLQVDEQKLEPEQVEEQKREPEQVEEQKLDPEQVEEQKLDPEQVEEKKCEPEQVEEKKCEPEQVEEQKREPEQVEEQKREPEQVEEQNQEVLQVDEQKQESVREEDSELVQEEEKVPSKEHEEDQVTKQEEDLVKALGPVKDQDQAVEKLENESSKEQANEQGQKLANKVKEQVPVKEQEEEQINEHGEDEVNKRVLLREEQLELANELELMPVKEEQTVKEQVEEQVKEHDQEPVMEPKELPMQKLMQTNEQEQMKEQEHEPTKQQGPSKEYEDDVKEEQVEEVEHIPEAEQEQEPTKEQEMVKEMVKVEPEPLREEGHMQSELQEVLLQEGDEIKALVARNSMQKMVPAVNFDPETKMEVPEVPEQEQLNNNSYELKGEEVKSLPALPRRPTPPPKPSPPQLADGSHFMCV